MQVLRAQWPKVYWTSDMSKLNVQNGDTDVCFLLVNWLDIL